MRSPSMAAARSLCAVRVASRSLSILFGDTKPCCASCSVRRWVMRACSSATVAAAMRLPACRTVACAAPMRAFCSRIVRSSSIGLSAGRSCASASPALTASPSRSVMRCSLPASGAETTKRSRRRVRASSSIVVSKRPTLAVATSTSIGRGANAHTSRAARAATVRPPNSRVLRCMCVFYSRVLSAATMSSRSMRRRTTSALASPAATTQMPAQA